VPTLKDRLESSKVYFETIAAVLLSLMAILVSIAQSCTAARQTDLLDKQTKIAEVQMLPEFNIYVQLEYDEQRKVYTEDTLVVDNNGGSAHEWNVQTAEFIVLTYGGPSKTIELAVNGYYGAAFRSAAHRGHLVTLRGSGNNNHFGDLYMELLDSHPCDVALVDLDRYVRVSFKDVLGRRSTEYYNVAAVSGARHLPLEAGEAAFKRWESQSTSGQLLEFSRVTPDLLRSRLQGVCEQPSKLPGNDSRPGSD